MNRRILWGGLAVAAFAVLSGVAVLRSSGAESSWKELSSVIELREQFNQDKDSIRIVLLLSPT
jgi:hypothetical protein